MLKMTREEIEKNPKVKEHECPGSPTEGGCEFCPGNCFSYSLNGEWIVLIENENYYRD